MLNEKPNPTTLDIIGLVGGDIANGQLLCIPKVPCHSPVYSSVSQLKCVWFLLKLTGNQPFRTRWSNQISATASKFQQLRMGMAAWPHVANYTTRVMSLLHHLEDISNETLKTYSSLGTHGGGSNFSKQLCMVSTESNTSPPTFDKNQ